jgi:hypothetical protein
MLSRRHFLQLSGIALASVSLPSLTTATFSPADALSSLAPTLETVYGRTFATTRVYDAPTLASRIGQRLWANTVAPILDTDDDWYRLNDGYVLRRNMQPMIAPARRSEAALTPPFWAEVSGAVGIVRESCQANARIIRQIGHGGILRMIDWLPGDGVDWYGVAERESGDLMGWSQSAVWSSVQEERESPTLTVAVDTKSYQLTVYDSDQVVLSAPVSTERTLTPGVYRVSERNVSRGAFAYYGAPWSLTFGDNQHLTGVYWHNRFGAETSGEALQVTPALARWLYPRAAEVIIS